VLVLETGVGAAAMEAALTWLLGTPSVGGKPYSPPAVICSGFSGALRPGLAVGDLLLAAEVADEHGGRWTATWPSRPLPPYPVPVATGRLLTASRPVAAPADKLDLGRLHDAATVDMETAAVARLCTRHGVPFGCLRAVSDDGATALSPALADVLRGGRVAPGALASAVLRRPSLVRELVRLAGDTRRAALRLADGLDALLAAHGGDVVGG
jgi:adenosylhomocysteine nucleosidase